MLYFHLKFNLFPEVLERIHIALYVFQFFPRNNKLSQKAYFVVRGKHFAFLFFIFKEVFPMNKNIQRAKGLTATINTHEGGKAYAPSFKETLVEFFSLGLLTGNFYESESDVLKNASWLFNKALTECPEFATKAAIYGAEKNSMKLVPMLWLAYVSTLEDKTLFKVAFPRIITNPKLLYDFMEIVRKTDIRQGLGRSVKTTMNTWLHDNLNDYYATRYKNKLAEIAKVTRPTYKEDTAFQNYMQYISKDKLSIERAIALKALLGDLSSGIYNDNDKKLVHDFKIQLEEVKHSVKNLNTTAKKDLYTDIYSTMNYMALIMNLVSLERVFAIRTTEVFQHSARGSFKTTKVCETAIPYELVKMVSARISDLAAYRKSRILPFTLLAASKMVVTPEFKTAISSVFQVSANECFNISAENSVMVGVDTSASMMSSLTESLIISDVACLFGAMMKKSYPPAKVCAVASICKPVNLKNQQTIDSMCKDILSTYVGYGTNFETILSQYNNEKFVIIVTDGEQSDNFEAKWRNTPHPSGAKVIVWQLMPYNHVISKSPDFIYLRGYSDKMLSVIKNIIEDDGNALDEVKKITL